MNDDTKNLLCSVAVLLARILSRDDIDTDACADYLAQMLRVVCADAEVLDAISVEQDKHDERAINAICAANMNAN